VRASDEGGLLREGHDALLCTGFSGQPVCLRHAGCFARLIPEEHPARTAGESSPTTGQGSGSRRAALRTHTQILNAHNNGSPGLADAGRMNGGGPFRIRPANRTPLKRACSWQARIDLWKT
jgi:hypothetical protein